MDTPDHKFELTKVTLALGTAGCAKLCEFFNHPIDFFMGFSLADWAALFAVIYSLMQIVMSLPKFSATVIDWFHRVYLWVMR